MKVKVCLFKLAEELLLVKFYDIKMVDLNLSGIKFNLGPQSQQTKTKSSTFLKISENITIALQWLLLLAHYVTEIWQNAEVSMVSCIKY